MVRPFFFLFGPSSTKSQWGSGEKSAPQAHVTQHFWPNRWIWSFCSCYNIVIGRLSSRQNFRMWRLGSMYILTNKTRWKQPTQDRNIFRKWAAMSSMAAHLEPDFGALEAFLPSFLHPPGSLRDAVDSTFSPRRIPLREGTATSPTESPRLRHLRLDASRVRQQTVRSLQSTRAQESEDVTKMPEIVPAVLPKYLDCLDVWVFYLHFCGIWDGWTFFFSATGLFF